MGFGTYSKTSDLQLAAGASQIVRVQENVEFHDAAFLVRAMGAIAHTVELLYGSIVQSAPVVILAGGCMANLFKVGGPYGPNANVRQNGVGVGIRITNNSAGTAVFRVVTSWEIHRGAN